jgi:hypothetical protein
MLQVKEQRTTNENAARGLFANDREGAFSDFGYSRGASVANTPIQLIDPETNHNGIDLLHANIFESSAAALPFWVLMAATRSPAGINDGYVISSPTQGSNAAASFVLSADIDRKIYLPPNHGLFLFPLVASDSGSRHALFRRL